jgi:hypothetical protein
VAVRPEDCRRICSTGCAKLRVFNSITEENHILRLAFEPPQPSVCTRINDLVVLDSDRKRFEEQYEITAVKVTEASAKKPDGGFVASEDYRYVKLDGIEFHFGDIQARIVQLLHDASQSHKPWVHGKTLIYESGSNAVRVRDLFKTKRDWRKLVVSNDRGYYRLNIPIEQLAQPNSAAQQEAESHAA